MRFEESVPTLLKVFRYVQNNGTINDYMQQPRPFYTLAYMEKDYLNAISLISGMTFENEESRVESAYLKGMCYLELSDIPNAITCFTYVVNNGNKLHRVKQATSILNHITKPN